MKGSRISLAHLMALALATAGRVHFTPGRHYDWVWVGGPRPPRPTGPLTQADGYVWDNVARCAITPETADRWGTIRSANERQKAGLEKVA